MFGVARVPAAGLGARFFGARFFGVRLVGVRFFSVIALRGERDLRAMIPPTRPAPPCHGRPGRVTPEAISGLRLACGKVQAN
jgi:hypothetical protein